MAVAMGEQRRRREAMDLLVQEIAKGEDENVSMAIRTALERGYAANFMESLVEARRKKEGEIDRICARHYSDFLSSVAEMLRMRGSASALTKLVSEVHRDFSDSGEDLIKVLTNLEEIQTEREQARVVLESTLRCKDLATLMVQAKTQIDAEDHYQAMRTLDKLQILQSSPPALPRPMALCLERWLPQATMSLLKATRNEADQMLNLLRGQALIMGQTILRRQAALSTDRNRSRGRSQSMVSAWTSDLPDSPSSEARGRRLSSVGGDAAAHWNSFSLSLVRRNAQVLRLSSWLRPSELDAWSSGNFIGIPSGAPSSSEGEDIMERLPGSLGPLHKALHIASVLGDTTTLHEHIRSKRLPAMTSMMDGAERDVKQAAQQPGGGLASVAPDLVASIAGLFTLECLIRRCVERPEGVFAWHEVATVWDKACIRLDVIVGKQGDTIRTPEQLLQTKDELSLLAEVVSDEALGLRATAIHETMRLLWNRLEELQVEAVQNATRDGLTHSQFQPLIVDSEEIYAEKIRAFRLENVQLDPHKPDSGSTHGGHSMDQRDQRGGARSSMVGSVSSAGANLDALEGEMGLELGGGGGVDGGGGGGVDDVSAGNRARTQSAPAVHLPQVFPFSIVVPTVHKALYMCVVRLVGFAARNPMLNNHADSACQSILRAYEGVVSVMKHELVRDGADTPLSKACQMSIDAAALALVSVNVWQYLATALHSLRWAKGLDEAIVLAAATAKKHLVQLSLQAQDVIIEALGLKVNDLLGSLVFINYLPEVLPRVAHESVEEVVDFLQVTLMCLTHLPRAAREVAHFTCCNGVASGLLEHILSNKVPGINVLALAALDLDCRRLAQFALGTGVPSLNQCFSELHELVQVSIHPDLHKLADDVALRRKLFPRLDASKLANILEKMVPVPVGINTASLPRIDKNSLRGLAKKFRTQSRE